MASSKEEVNAWGSYDQVAKSARALPRRRTAPSARDGGDEIAAFSRHSAHSGRWLRASGGDVANVSMHSHRSWRATNDVEDGMRRASRKSAYEFAVSGLDRKTLLELAAEENDVATDEQHQEQPRVEEPKEPYEQAQSPGVKLPQDVNKDDIRDIFCVYFEGCHDEGSGNEGKDESSKPWWSRLLLSVNGTMPWLRDYIKTSVRNESLQKSLLFTQKCFRGIAQVYFMNNPFSGLLILIGLLVQSTRVAVYGLVAVICGNLSAYVLGFNKDLLNSGLFGYNGFLVGLALATFDTSETHTGYSGSVFGWSIVMSAFSSVIFVSMGKLLVPYKSPPLTFPFNIATLMLMVATAEMTRVQVGPVREPALPDYSGAGDENGELTARMFFAGMVRGIGQVYLANNLASGLLVLAGIAVCSRISAVAAVVGSALGAAFAVATGVNAAAIENGLYGFNSSLSVTAMFMFYVPSMGAGMLSILAALLTIVGQQALAGLLQPYGLPFLTLPFCVITLPFIILQGTTSLVISVPLATMTIPEDHLRRIQMLSDGYQFFKDSIHQEREKRKYGKGLSKTLRRLSTTFSTESVEASSSRVPRWSLPSLPKTWSCEDTKKPASHDKEEWVEEAAKAMFDGIDTDQSGSIDLEEFTAALESAGLTEDIGIKFASLVFELMLEGAGETTSIDRCNFVAFALASRALLDIHRKVSQFVDFVNVDGGEFVSLKELESASEYLGQPPLTGQEETDLIALNGIVVDEEVDACFDVIELVNFVTVSYLKALVSEYRGNSECAASTRRSAAP